MPIPYGYGGAADLLFGNGGRRVLNLGKSEQDKLWGDLAPRVARLPYIITVGEGPTQFHIAHAKPMTGRADESNTLYGRMDGRKKEVLTDAMINDEVLATMIEPLTWGWRLTKKARDSKTSEVVTLYGKLAVSHQPWHPGLTLTYVRGVPR